MAVAKGSKGFATEELVRSYFVLAGFYVIRSVPLRYNDDELTDLDIWIYERSAVLARRRTIIDVKDKKLPQAAERMFFVSGAAKIVGVEGAGVATTDTRPALRELAQKQNLLWIDGDDLKRLRVNRAISEIDRISEEVLFEKIDDLDKARGNRNIRSAFVDLKSTVGDRFGASSGNLALDAFEAFSNEFLVAHPNSSTAEVFLRLAYWSASLVAASFDFAAGSHALRPTSERIEILAEQLSYGAGTSNALARIDWAEEAIRQYLPDRAALGGELRRRLVEAIEQRPTTDLAEIVVRLSNTDRLFQIARTLEFSTYQSKVPSFDALEIDARGFVGALLDFCGVERARFARSWTKAATSERPASKIHVSDSDMTQDVFQSKLL
jgi:hypothetical protein